MRPKRANAPSALWLFFLGVVLALFGTHAGRYWDFTVDDAGISFAYARNLARGLGMVLSPGAERVEAATNFLWCLLLVPAHWMGDHHELFSKVLGLAGGCATLVALAFFPSIAYQRKPAYYDLVAPLATACLPLFALWSVAGLENGVYAAFLASSLVALAHEENDTTRFPWSSLLLALAFATRPDAALYIGVVGATKLLRQVSPRPLRQDLIWGLVLLLGIGSLELFRLAYFAWPLPNSFYTKKRTWEFGKDLFDTHNAGWGYVANFLHDYKLSKAIFVVPLVLLGVRAAVARIALLGFVLAAIFLPVYSHGDWMDEYRFLSFGVPFIILAIAEAGRAVVRFSQITLPKRVRPIVALALTPLVAYFVLSETTQYYPERLRAAVPHQTTEMRWVMGRAQYFAAAAHRLAIDGHPALLDPDVGASSYDGRFRIVDLFGLGDIAIAHTHPDNPPGSREAIYWERRPEFIHLHGAWFGAMELQRLEEIELGYLRLPMRLPDGESEDGSDYVNRAAVAAPWYETAELHFPSGIPAGGSLPDGYTVSHHALEPGRRVMLEFTIANIGNSPAGSVALIGDRPRARPLEGPVEPAGSLFSAHEFIPGERPRARIAFTPAVGTYEITYRSGSHTVSLGRLLVRAGAGDAESRTLRDQLDALLHGDQYGRALAIARQLGLRVVADPRDVIALDALAHYGQALADRARVLASADPPALRTAALLAREARAWASHDPRTVARIEDVAERIAEAGRRADRMHDAHDGFLFAREAVLTDPHRSWSRRRAEELRPRAGDEYDGGRDQAAYRFAAAVLQGTADLDPALVFLGSVHRWTEAAALAERAGRTPVDPRARVVVARGLISRGDARGALALVSGQPCASAHDVELTRALRAVYPQFRQGDAACLAVPPGPPLPFDTRNGSFEMPRWGVWTVIGNAFGPGPSHTHPERQQFVNGWRGWHFANSFSANTDERTGVLRSPAFMIETDGMSFLVAGGSDSSHVGVRLIVDGQTVLRAAGENSEGLHRVFWDLRPWRGRRAIVEVFDESVVGWGHVLADDFRLEPVLPPGVASAPHGS